MRYKIYLLIKCLLLYCVFSSLNLVSGQIRYSIPEELQLGAFVGNIAADLGLDKKQLSARRLQIATGARKQYVDVQLDDGVLFVKEKIDRETLCGPSLTCVLSLDVMLENPLNLYQVEVEIFDVNDNAPSFPRNQLRLEISEIAAPGARFPLDSAHDPDIGNNSLQTYQLLPNEYFIVDVQLRSREGKLPVLVLQRPLDREKLSSHTLTLIAKDGGTPVRSGTVQVIITVKDANDNAPVFSQSVYRVSLLETAPIGTLIIRLNATDLDDGSNGEIMYSLSSHTSAVVRKLFAVDSKTGEIRLKGDLDFEQINAFEINVQAMDKGPYAMPKHCEVLVNIIDMNDNAPEVTLRSLSSTVSEDDPVGTVVALFSAADKDSGRNGQVECHISNKLPFKLESSMKNYYRLIIQHRLDREDTSRYDVAIACTDSGSPPLTTKKNIRVEVSDINDNAPRFRQRLYTANVMEDNVIGSSIFSVTAFDPDAGQNARLNYSILETQVQNASVSTYISINSESGIIYSQKSFDYERLNNFQIQVQAQDSGTPPLASNVSVNVIILDQNDNVPVIVHPLAEYGSTAVETISKFAEPGYLVTKVSATDADSGQNARLSYSIFQATQHNLFTISPDSGEIWTIRRIVNNDASKQRLVIVVKDNGTPSLSATVTIILSVIGNDIETVPDESSLSDDPVLTADLSYTLVIALGIISTSFLVISIILAIKVHNGRNALGGQHCSPGPCCCFEARNSLNGIQKASRNLQIPPNYVEVFGGDPLSQSFRYESCSTLQSTKRDFITPNTVRSSTDKNYIWNKSNANENPGLMNSENYPNPVTTEGNGWEFIVDQTTL
ncbi:protocadherin-10-like isoform X2 [Carcharodon carcharias]|uniref:protocadherin-10-like isoform X2 n=1 Tax=Carcharodon carcharias TaxID=13397 RepID=UPI001B7DFE73|nr:protocadherin-10-like isoform X2 [Carcharodon carcharias]